MANEELEPVRRAREALARRVGEYADPAKAWELVLQCTGSCKPQRRLVADLVPVLAPDLIWAEVVMKFRCRHCQSPADIMGLVGPPAVPGLGGIWLLLQGSTGMWRS